MKIGSILSATISGCACNNKGCYLFTNGNPDSAVIYTPSWVKYNPSYIAILTTKLMLYWHPDKQRTKKSFLTKENASVIKTLSGTVCNILKHIKDHRDTIIKDGIAKGMDRLQPTYFIESFYRSRVCTIISYLESRNDQNDQIAAIGAAEEKDEHAARPSKEFRVQGNVESVANGERQHLIPAKFPLYGSLPIKTGNGGLNGSDHTNITILY